MSFILSWEIWSHNNKIGAPTICGLSRAEVSKTLKELSLAQLLFPLNWNYFASNFHIFQWMLTHNNKIGASTVSSALAEPKSEGRGQDAQLWFPLNWNYFASNFVTMSKTNPTGPITVEQGPSVFLGGKKGKRKKRRGEEGKRKNASIFLICVLIFVLERISWNLLDLKISCIL